MAFLEAFSKIAEVAEGMEPDVQKYKEIKPETGITKKEVKDFWNNLFKDMKQEGFSSKENYENRLEKISEEYLKDLKEKSDVKDTLPDKLFEVSDLRKISPEQNAIMREEFNDTKKDLIHQWEKKNGRSWPTYEKDVYISTKSGEITQIRKAGDHYDVHHIQPLGLGGKNEVDNITPLKADCHYDHRGVHEQGSPYDRLDKILGEMNNDE